jgi:peptidoglycan/xylan/chitin deacetylase (PgdA/CDA1 family)
MTTHVARRATRLVTAVALTFGALTVPPVAPVTTVDFTLRVNQDCPAGRDTVIRAAPGAGKTVALTFDDGPTKFTPQILKILRRHNVRATFFQPGNKLAASPARARQVVDEGHLVANHTYDHRYPTQVAGGWSRTYLRNQLRRASRTIRQRTGQQACFFRPPGGYLTPGLTSVVANHGMTTVMWSVDTEDWKQPGVTTPAATARIIDRAKAGASQAHPVVLMHDGKASREPESEVSSNRSNDVAALPAIIRFYMARNYRFVDMLGRSGLPPAPTTLRIANSGEVKEPLAGDRVVAVAGRLRALTGPVADVKIRWYHRDHARDTWEAGGTVQTNHRGRFAVLDNTTVATRYRVEFAGNRHYAATKGRGYQLVDPRTLATNLIVSAPDSVALGAPAEVTGSVRSAGNPRSSVPVTISWETQDGTQAIHVEQIVTGDDGTFTWQAPAATGTTAYTISIAAALPYESASATLIVSVTD